LQGGVMMLLELIDIYKGYGIPGSRSFRPVLYGLNWRLDAGKRVGIVGPSGSGKTTFLNLAGALDRPDSGEVVFNGKQVTSFSDTEMAWFRNRELGFVFQQHHLLPQCTLWENVLLPVLAAKKKADVSDKAWAEYLLKKTGIWEQRNQKPAELSGGECQRTAVVRALINRPELLLADEPTGALDEKNAAILSELLTGLSREEGIALVTVTHEPELAAMMDEVYLLHEGRATKQN